MTGIVFDIVAGVAVVIGGVAGAALSRRRRDPYAAGWKPLAALIGGRAHGSRLTGSYDGLPVTARVFSTKEGAGELHFWEVAFALPAAGVDWSMAYTGQKFLRTGAKAWRLKCKDEAVIGRLTGAGIVDLMKEWQSKPEIDFKSKTGLLCYRDQIPSAAAIPSATDFQSHLDLLAKLARVSQENNVTGTVA